MIDDPPLYRQSHEAARIVREVKGGVHNIVVRMPVSSRERGIVTAAVRWAAECGVVVQTVEGGVDGAGGQVRQAEFGAVESVSPQDDGEPGEPDAGPDLGTGLPGVDAPPV